MAEAGRRGLSCLPGRRGRSFRLQAPHRQTQLLNQKIQNPVIEIQQTQSRPCLFLGPLVQIGPFILVIQEIRRIVVSRANAAPMHPRPSLLGINQNLGNQRMVSLGLDARHGKRQNALRGDNTGPVADGLLGIGFGRFHLEAPGPHQGGTIIQRRQISRTDTQNSLIFHHSRIFYPLQFPILHENKNKLSCPSGPIQVFACIFHCRQHGASGKKTAHWTDTSKTDFIFS